jgi:tetratricopeptide (TPR) repeat protein
MNTRLVEFWDKALAAIAVSAAFCLPLAFHLEAYDTGIVKDAALLGAALLTAACALARAIETGRFEIPSNRFLPAMAIVIGMAATVFFILRNPGGSLFNNELVLATAGILLYVLVMTGPASISFATALIDAALLSGAVVALYALAQMLGYDPLPWRGAYTGAFSTMGSPEALGVLLGALFPLGLARGADEGATAFGRLAARAAALLAVLGVLATAAPAGLYTLWLASAAFGLFGLGIFCTSTLRADALAALAVIPLTAWVSLQGGVFAELPILRTYATPLLWGGGLLLCWTLTVSINDGRRRAQEGEHREPVLIAGQWALVLALAGSTLIVQSGSSASGLCLLFAASLAGLAKERGGSIVRVLPIPAPVAIRRAIYLPLTAAVVLGVARETRSVNLNIAFNRGISAAQAGDWIAAKPFFDLSGAHAHTRSLEAYFLATRAIEETNANDDALKKLRHRYQNVWEKQPSELRVDYRLARANARLGDWDRAHTLYKNAVAKYPRHLDAWRELSDTALLAGDSEGALGAAIMLVSLDPKEPRHWHFLSSRYRQMGKNAIARRMLDRAERVHAVAEARKKATTKPL